MTRSRFRPNSLIARLFFAAVLWTAFLLPSNGAQAQDVRSQGREVQARGEAILRRPPVVSTCDECPALDSWGCAISTVACADCWNNCERPGEIRRVSPRDAPHDPFAGSYNLPKTIGVVQVAYEPEPVRGPVTAHFTSYELLQEVLNSGFGSLKIWLDAMPFEGMGLFCWETYYGFELCGDYNLEGLDMARFWNAIPDGTVIFLRPVSMGWTWSEYNPCTETGGPQMALADYYSISMRLYELIGDHAVQIVYTDWEQDWTNCHELDGFLVRIIEQRQRDVERARREIFEILGHKPKLEIYHAVIVNKFPNNAAEWPYPYLTETIATLTNRPDFIGVSYWLNGYDPIETLEWIREVTGYPPSRIYIDEIGAIERRQTQRFEDYIPALWEWGVRTINVWMWKQTWCDGDRNLGLWKQSQPCRGKVEFTEPTAGYWKIQELMNE